MSEKPEPLKINPKQNFTTSSPQETGTLAEQVKAISELPATQKVPFVSPHIVSNLPKPEPIQSSTSNTTSSQSSSNTPNPSVTSNPSSENSGQ